MDREEQKKQKEKRVEQPREDRRDPPGGQVAHEERKGDAQRQPEEPHGDSEAV